MTTSPNQVVVYVANGEPVAAEVDSPFEALPDALCHPGQQYVLVRGGYYIVDFTKTVRFKRKWLNEYRQRVAAATEQGGPHGI